MLQGTPMNEFVKKSVSQTVKYNYNSNNTAAMKTFDMVQEGVSQQKFILHKFSSIVLAGVLWV